MRVEIPSPSFPSVCELSTRVRGETIMKTVPVYELWINYRGGSVVILSSFIDPDATAWKKQKPQRTHVLTSSPRRIHSTLHQPGEDQSTGGMIIFAPPVLESDWKLTSASVYVYFTVHAYSYLYSRLWAALLFQCVECKSYEAVRTLSCVWVTAAAECNQA